jgi:hypothetical protein
MKMKRKILGFPLILFLEVIAFSTLTKSCEKDSPLPDTCQTDVTVSNKSGSSIYIGDVWVMPTEEFLCANGKTKQWISSYPLPINIKDCFSEAVGKVCEIRILDSSGTVIYFNYFYPQAASSDFTWDGKTIKMGKH